MTPMIDIVFLLIIFFMTVTQVSKLNKEQLDLAKLKGTQDQKPSVVTVNIMDSGEIRVSGSTLPLSELISLINRELRRVGDEPKLLTVVLRIDQRGTSATPNEVIKSLKKLFIDKVHFAVEVPK